MPSCGQTGCGQTVLPDDLDTEAARRRFMEDGKRAVIRQEVLDFKQHLFDLKVHQVGRTHPHARMTCEVVEMFRSRQRRRVTNVPKRLASRDHTGERRPTAPAEPYAIPPGPDGDCPPGYRAIYDWVLLHHNVCEIVDCVYDPSEMFAAVAVALAQLPDSFCNGPGQIRKFRQRRWRRDVEAGLNPDIADLKCWKCKDDAWTALIDLWEGRATKDEISHLMAFGPPCPNKVQYCGQPLTLTLREQLDEWPSRTEISAAFHSIDILWESSPDDYAYNLGLNETIATGIALLRKNREIVRLAACTIKAEHKAVDFIEAIESRLQVGILAYEEGRDCGLAGAPDFEENSPYQIIICPSAECMVDRAGGIAAVAHSCLSVQEENLEYKAAFWAACLGMACVIAHEAAHLANFPQNIAEGQHKGGKCDEIYIFENALRYYLMRKYSLALVGPCLERWEDRGDSLVYSDQNLCALACDAPTICVDF